MSPRRRNVTANLTGELSERGRKLGGRQQADQLLELRGAVGARALMGAHDVVDVDCTGTGDPSDVDTLDDLRALEGRTR